MKQKFEELNPSSKAVVLVCIFLLLLGLLIFVIAQKKHHYKYGSDDLKVVKKNKLDTFGEFMAVENDINKFIKINNDNVVYDLLDESYIKKNNVYISNALQKVNRADTNYNFTLRHLEALKSNDDYIVYYCTGVLTDIGDDYDEEPGAVYKVKILNKSYSLMLIIDYNTISYSVYPDITRREALETINNKKDFKIERNNNNKLMKTSVSSYVDMCRKYYSDLVFNINYMPDHLYTILDTTRKNSFKSKEKFEKYLEENYKEYPATFKRCEKGKSSREYYIYDETNTFKLVIHDIMNYNVDLP